MVLSYEFETSYSGYSEAIDEDFWETISYELEIDTDDKKKVATKMVMEDVGCDKEMAKRIVEDLLWQNDMLEDYLQKDIEYVTNFFENRALRLCREEREM